MRDPGDSSGISRRQLEAASGIPEKEKRRLSLKARLVGDALCIEDVYKRQGHGYVTEAVKAVTKWAFENYEIPYLIGTVEVSNMKSQKVLERCSYQFIDERTLLVHAEGIQYRFKYYRFYPAK